MNRTSQDLERILDDLRYASLGVEDMRLKTAYGDKPRLVEAENFIEEAMEDVQAAINALEGR